MKTIYTTVLLLLLSTFYCFSQDSRKVIDKIKTSIKRTNQTHFQLANGHKIDTSELNNFLSQLQNLDDLEHKLNTTIEFGYNGFKTDANETNTYNTGIDLKMGNYPKSLAIKASANFTRTNGEVTVNNLDLLAAGKFFIGKELNLLNFEGVLSARHYSNANLNVEHRTEVGFGLNTYFWISGKNYKRGDLPDKKELSFGKLLGTIKKLNKLNRKGRLSSQQQLQLDSLKLVLKEFRTKRGKRMLIASGTNKLDSLNHITNEIESSFTDDYSLLACTEDLCQPVNIQGINDSEKNTFKNTTKRLKNALKISESKFKIYWFNGLMLENEKMKRPLKLYYKGNENTFDFNANQFFRFVTGPSIDVKFNGISASLSYLRKIKAFNDSRNTVTFTNPSTGELLSNGREDFRDELKLEIAVSIDTKTSLSFNWNYIKINAPRRKYFDVNENNIQSENFVLYNSLDYFKGFQIKIKRTL